MKPQISVIIPVYNSEKALHRCIDSLLAQTFSDFELLIVDDGSTDASGAICDEYAAADSRVRVFHKPNGGVSSARNLGLENARSEWVTFVDSDDYVYDSFLANYDVENAENYDWLCQGIRGSHGFTGEKCGEDFVKIDFDGEPFDLVEKLYYCNCLGYVVIKAYRMSIIRKHSLKFDTNIKFMEDEVFVLSYIRFAKNARSVGNIGYFYNYHNGYRKYHLTYDEDIYLESKLVNLIQEIDKDSRFPTYALDKRRLLTNAYLMKIAKEFDFGSTRKIRDCHLANHNFSPLNKICRNILIYDPTLILSTIAICCHMRLRAWLKR